LAERVETLFCKSGIARHVPVFRHGNGLESLNYYFALPAELIFQQAAA